MEGRPANGAGRTRVEEAGAVAVGVPEQGPRSLVERMEHHQVAVYLAALAAGGLLGRTAPGLGPGERAGSLGSSWLKQLGQEPAASGARHTGLRSTPQRP